MSFCYPFISDSGRVLHLFEFDAFAQALIEKTEVSIQISDAVANMAVLDAVFAAAASGKWEVVAKY